MTPSFNGCQIKSQDVISLSLCLSLSVSLSLSLSLCLSVSLSLSLCLSVSLSLSLSLSRCTFFFFFKQLSGILHPHLSFVIVREQIFTHAACNRRNKKPPTCSFCRHRRGQSVCSVRICGCITSVFCILFGNLILHFVICIH